MTEIWLRRSRQDFDGLPINMKQLLEDRGITPEQWETTGYVFATRRQARQLIGEYADAVRPITLRADAVEVATPSFFHELLKVWPDAKLADANEDVQECFNLAKRDVQ